MDAQGKKAIIYLSDMDLYVVAALYVMWRAIEVAIACLPRNCYKHCCEVTCQTCTSVMIIAHHHNIVGHFLFFYFFSRISSLEIKKSINMNWTFFSFFLCLFLQLTLRIWWDEGRFHVPPCRADLRYAQHLAPPIPLHPSPQCQPPGWHRGLCDERETRGTVEGEAGSGGGILKIRGNCVYM